MRLLETSTLKVIDSFSIGESVAYQYAILSHTWDGDELTLQEMEGPHKKIKEKRGYLKVAGACALALENGFKYIWIDTCCIDKTNSVELSEAINSMWQWYKESAVCYVYLVDIPDHLSARNLDRRGDMKFQTSRWFTRGWTLQELLAPRFVEFYASDWSEIGTKYSLATRLHKITRISKDALDGKELSSFSVAERMSWAARRKTTRPEDMAYCLLGIFEVNLPLIYGEGRGSFYRLQEEIMKRYEDYTILLPGFCDGSHIPTLDEELLEETMDLDMASQPRETTEGFKILEYSSGPWNTHTGPRKPLIASDIHSFRTPIPWFNQPRPGATYSGIYTDNDRGPWRNQTSPRFTARGLHISTGLQKCSGTPSFYLLYCRCKMNDNLICLFLKRDERKDLILRHIEHDSRFVLVPSKYRNRFQYNDVYLDTTFRDDTNALSRSTIGGYGAMLTIDLSKVTQRGLTVATSHAVYVGTSFGLQARWTPWKTWRYSVPRLVINYQENSIGPTLVWCSIPKVRSDVIVLFEQRSCEIFQGTLNGSSSPLAELSDASKFPLPENLLQFFGISNFGLGESICDRASTLIKDLLVTAAIKRRGPGAGLLVSFETVVGRQDAMF
ncbi:heterokaryon incompatibility protein-domain-containing protein [Truncatella angustata]|uniref:Heterokaryon incompatibility protein-domain-containing protein n=1 Tax=Truncatella angustata TaxID=152316 RepID=A0A9P8UYY2_9PEZI|nr:heterokaryon incompatibility protein-domain-containing protein [Truncatella angustata]KAH6660690.1 heterokaryon incompatibility protein-domain-containing protein [Truncatella angustata]